MANAGHDQNHVPTLAAISNADGVTIVPLYADPTTHRLLVDSASGTGTVTTVSVVTANGISGSVATATSTPAITLTLGAITPTTVNSQTISSAASFTGTILAASYIRSGAANSDFETYSLIGAWSDTASAIENITYSDTPTVTPQIAFKRARGTQAAKTTMVSGDRLGAFFWRGYDGSNFLATAGMVTVADGTVSAGSLPSAITFETGATGTRTERLRITSAGEVQFNGAAVPKTSDVAALGSTTLMWSDLFLASGSVINFNNSDVTLTHAANLITLAGGQFNFGANTAYFTETDNGNSSTADTIDWTLSNKQKSTLTGNCTFTFTAPGGPANLVLKLVQDGTGSRTVTWPATVHWSGGTAPTLTTTASRVDIITLYYDGTTYFGSYSLNYVA